MSAKASSGCPAPLDVEFSVVKEFAQYVVHTKAGHAWRIHSHNDKTGFPFDPVILSEREESRWDFKSDSRLPYSDGVLLKWRIGYGAGANSSANRGSK
jgi:hypothetical protein